MRAEAEILISRTDFIYFSNLNYQKWHFQCLEQKSETMALFVAVSAWKENQALTIIVLTVGRGVVWSPVGIWSKDLWRKIPQFY